MTPTPKQLALPLFLLDVYIINPPFHHLIVNDGLTVRYYGKTS